MIKHVDIVTPTRNRYLKLSRMLSSVPLAVNGISLRHVIVCDADPGSARALLEDPRVGLVIFVRAHSGSVACRNLAIQAAEDAVIYATDDIKFQPGAIEAAVAAMNRRFPEGDGVVGFVQVNATEFSPTGVALVGQAFLRRYPNRKLFCPLYHHFSCQEIERAAEILNRLEVCKEARVVHYHPSYFPEEADRTHVEARKWRDQDKCISLTRKAKCLVWGVND